MRFSLKNLAQAADALNDVLRLVSPSAAQFKDLGKVFTEMEKRADFRASIINDRALVIDVFRILFEGKIDFKREGLGFLLSSPGPDCIDAGLSPDRFKDGEPDDSTRQDDIFFYFPPPLKNTR